MPADFDGRDAVFDPGDGWRVTFVNSLGEIEVGEVQARRFMWSLDAADEATISFDGNAVAAASYIELATDILVYHDGVIVFRGRGGQVTDTGSVDRDSVTVTAFEYRELLARRLLLAGSTVGFSAVDQAQIAWTMLNEAQARSGGALGITQGLGFTAGVGSTGVTRVRDYDLGRTVDELIDELAHVINGFEWEISPLLKLNVYYPNRGSATSVILDYGGAVTAFTRSMNPSNYANVMRVTGDDGVTPVETAIASIATVAGGRWEALDSTYDIKEDATLTARAAYDLAVKSIIPYTYSVALKAGYWTGPSLFFIGDRVILLIRSGRVNVNIVTRVTELEVVVTPDGAEDVRLTLEPVL